MDVPLFHGQIGRCLSEASCSFFLLLKKKEAFLYAQNNGKYCRVDNVPNYYLFQDENATALVSDQKFRLIHQVGRPICFIVGPTVLLGTTVVSVLDPQNLTPGLELTIPDRFGHLGVFQVLSVSGPTVTLVLESSSPCFSGFLGKFTPAWATGFVPSPSLFPTSTNPEINGIAISGSTDGGYLTVTVIENPANPFEIGLVYLFIVDPPVNPMMPSTAIRYLTGLVYRRVRLANGFTLLNALVNTNGRLTIVSMSPISQNQMEVPYSANPSGLDPSTLLRERYLYSQVLGPLTGINGNILQITLGPYQIVGNSNVNSPSPLIPSDFLIDPTPGSFTAIDGSVSLTSTISDVPPPSGTPPAPPVVIYTANIPVDSITGFHLNDTILFGSLPVLLATTRQTAQAGYTFPIGANINNVTSDSVYLTTVTDQLGNIIDNELVRLTNEGGGSVSFLTPLANAVLAQTYVFETVVGLGMPTFGSSSPSLITFSSPLNLTLPPSSYVVFPDAAQNIQTGSLLRSESVGFSVVPVPTPTNVTQYNSSNPVIFWNENIQLNGQALGTATITPTVISTFINIQITPFNRGPLPSENQRIILWDPVNNLIHPTYLTSVSQNLAQGQTLNSIDSESGNTFTVLWAEQTLLAWTTQGTSSSTIPIATNGSPIPPLSMVEFYDSTNPGEVLSSSTTEIFAFPKLGGVFNESPILRSELTHYPGLIGLGNYVSSGPTIFSTPNPVSLNIGFEPIIGTNLNPVLGPDGVARSQFSVTPNGQQTNFTFPSETYPPLIGTNEPLWIQDIFSQTGYTLAGYSTTSSGSGNSVQVNPGFNPSPSGGYAFFDFQNTPQKNVPATLNGTTLSFSSPPNILALTPIYFGEM